MDRGETTDSELEKQTNLNDGASLGDGTMKEMIRPQPTSRDNYPLPTNLIADAYHIFFIADPTPQLDPHDSQRTEFHFPTVLAGMPFAYTWEAYLYTGTGTSDDKRSFLMQAFGVAENRSLVTLDTAGTVDFVRGVTGSARTELEDYHGKTATHHILGNFGPRGSLSYEIMTEKGEKILGHTLKGQLGAGAGYAAVGDWATVSS
ncbi:hypothetical protein C8R45DRAFT_1067782 [Mycena sanguinolenta]|nr:hypothetical protein C8R45DRAFT_1067782 [Mycena sanguinolenta]